MTAKDLRPQPLVLCVGDTTYLDYGKILVKRDGYGPQGNGGNGLLLHSALAVAPEHGQPLGLLWQKLWNREHRAQASASETLEAKKKRQAKRRQARRARSFIEKESYRWVEAMTTVEQQVQASTRIIHVFDREGDIAEVFDQVQACSHTGVLVRAAHNRALEGDPYRLWEKLEAQAVRFKHEVELRETQKRKARTATLDVRFCCVQLHSPVRLSDSQLQVTAVYANEIDYPEGEEPVSWMLLTSEPVDTIEQARKMLRWYSYRWRVEEYHKILKSGCNVERYRLAAEGMKALLGFFSVIAVELLRLTYLQRTQPQMSAQAVLNAAQIEVLKAKSPRLPKSLTIQWAMESIARLGGYLEHRRNTPIGIQVLWRGWAKLEHLVEGWELAHQT